MKTRVCLIYFIHDCITDIKRPTDSTTSTRSGQTDITNDQMSTTNGQTNATSGQTNTMSE